MADLNWTIPIMRAGYAGRGVTYLAVAGLSLWAIWSGGEAQGTSDALERLSSSIWGLAVLWVIAAGLFAYAIWRGIDAVEDLEDYGNDAKGRLSRVGMVVTGLIHGVIAALAAGIAIGSASGGGSGGLSSLAETVMSYPGGRIVVAIVGAITLGSGVYYLIKGGKAEYRETLKANHFTRHYDWALRAGVMAQGVVVAVIGGLFLLAGFKSDGGEAGGMGKAFDWIQSQPLGQTLVVLLCLGLLGFAFFCFVNAAYRIIPKVAGDKIETLASKVRGMA